MDNNNYIKGRILHSQTREVIANVYRVCDEEAGNNAFKLPLKRKIERVALYTGASISSIRKIHKEDEDRRANNSAQLLKSPGKKRLRLSFKEKFDFFSDFSVIRNIIQRFYVEWKVVPTTKKLLQAVREQIDFPYCRESLRRLLKSNGFYWRKCQNKRKVLLERPNILHWRYKYIRAIRKYRQEGRNIVYLDETWVDNDMTLKKCWQNEEILGVLTNISSSGKYIRTYFYS